MTTTTDTDKNQLMIDELDKMTETVFGPANIYGNGAYVFIQNVRSQYFSARESDQEQYMTKWKASVMKSLFYKIATYNQENPTEEEIKKADATLEAIDFLIDESEETTQEEPMDPALRSAYFTSAMTAGMQSHVVEPIKLLLTNYATDLLENTSGSMDAHVPQLDVTCEKGPSLGAAVIKELHENKALTKVQQQSPLTMQAIQHQLLGCQFETDDKTPIVEACYRLNGLPAPEMDEDTLARYELMQEENQKMFATKGWDAVIAANKNAWDCN